MASDIGTSSQFSTSYLKPDPGDQADALWAQKVADNTGHLYHRPIQLPEALAVSVFIKQASHNGLRGVVCHGTGGASSDNLYVWAAGKIPDNTGDVTLQKSMSYTAVAGSFHQIDLDISSLSNGSAYAYKYSVGNVTSIRAASAMLVWGTAATF